MKCTKEKYLIYFYNQNCGSLIDFDQDQTQDSITHETQKNTLGKASAKNPAICIIIQGGNIS